MASILIFDDETKLANQNAVVLQAAGHTVEVFSSPHKVRERLTGPACDLMLLRVERADDGAGLLIPQARAAWSDCRIVVLSSSEEFRGSKLHEMGLWTPDLVLQTPVGARKLRKTVNEMLAAPMRSAQTS